MNETNTQVLDKPPTTIPVFKPYKLTDINTKLETIDRLALGHKHSDIAKDNNCARITVTAFKKRNKEAIELKEQQFIDDNLDNIRTQVSLDIDTSTRISQEYNKGGEFHSDATAFKALVSREVIKPLLTKIGIYPSRNNLINSGNITLNNQVNNQISNSVSNMIGVEAMKHLETLSNVEITDV